ncbi:MAG: M48 family metalloprotease [Candidatus Thorarchaeota archaeon]|nr:M48 family metalloprotease [Candidatus Thorarchaeota archaeon]
MSQVEDIRREKWTTLFLFLIVDALQILLVSVLTLDESTPLVIGFDISQSNPLISVSLFIGITIVQLTMVYYVTLGMLKGKTMIMIHPNFDKEQTYALKFPRDDLVKWSTEIAKNSGVSLKRIYIMQSPLPNAFTFSLPLVGAVLVISSNLMYLLDEEEVRSIIAHEVGHIKNRDSLVSIFGQMPSFFVDIIYLYFYVRIGLGVASALLIQFDFVLAGIRILVLVGFFILSRVMVFVAKILIQKSSRSAEHLSDYHGATTVGTAPTLNALIRLGQRVEAITSLIGEIRWLESLNPERSGPLGSTELTRMISSYPLDGIDEKNAKTMAPWVFLFTKLKYLQEIYGVDMSDKQIIDAIRPASSSLLEKREETKEEASETEKEPEPKVVDWREVDYDGDRRLSIDELNDLVKMLRGNPSKFMFDSEVGQNILMIDHPDFRSRVLFIADNCEL